MTTPPPPPGRRRQALPAAPPNALLRRLRRPRTIQSESQEQVSFKLYLVMGLLGCAVLLGLMTPAGASFALPLLLLSLPVLVLLVLLKMTAPTEARLLEDQRREEGIALVAVPPRPKRTKEEIDAKLKLRQIEHNVDEFDNEDVCDICQEVYQTNEIVAGSHNPECRHYYHHSCIVAWLVENDDCPVCRRAFILPDDDEEEQGEGEDANDETATDVVDMEHVDDDDHQDDNETVEVEEDENTQSGVEMTTFRESKRRSFFSDPQVNTAQNNAANEKRALIANADDDDDDDHYDQDGVIEEDEEMGRTVVRV